MASNLTDQNISDTYTQLLHIDGGSVSSQGKKRVRDGNGRATAMSVSNNASAPANKGIEVDGTETIETSTSNGDVAPYTDRVGGDQPHENIPPWYGCLVWKRVK